MELNVPQTSPLRILLICPDEVLRGQVQEAFAELGDEAILSCPLPGYPSGAELARSLRAVSPQVVFLSLSRPKLA